MTRLLSIVVPGSPVPKGRPRVGPNGARTPARTAQAEADLGWFVKTRLAGDSRTPTVLPCRVRLQFTSRFGAGDGRAPDVDNLIKLALDAMNHIVWVDDRQVIEVIARVERGAMNEQTEIEVETIEPGFAREDQ